MTVERKKIFAGLTINANLREYNRIGEISEFIHEVADVFVDHDAKTVMVFSKESLPIDRAGLKGLIGLDGLDLAQAAAKGNAIVDQVTDLRSSLKRTEVALASVRDEMAAVTAQRDVLLGKLQRVSEAIADEKVGKG